MLNFSRKKRFNGIYFVSAIQFEFQINAIFRNIFLSSYCLSPELNPLGIRSKSINAPAEGIKFVKLNFILK